MLQTESMPLESTGLPGIKIALVHDWLNQMGGAESVLEELVGLFPSAPIYTSIYAPEAMPKAYRTWDIRTSFMNWLPGVANHHQKYLPIYPTAFARFNLSGYDLVISNKSGFCHGVRTQASVPSEPAWHVSQAENLKSNVPKRTSNDGRRAIHICYCLTPTRYLWMFDQYKQREQLNSSISMLIQPMLTWLRKWDYAAAQRVDHFIAISRAVQKRIKEVYGRTSVIIHPPVDTEYFTPDFTSYFTPHFTPHFTPTSPPAFAGLPNPTLPVDLSIQNPQKHDGYYLIVSRMIPYKRIDLAVEAFRQLPGERLIIAGDGRDRAALQAAAPPNVTFVGRVDRATIRDLLRACKAFLFPGLEDFGIAPVEALACGRPVLAFAGGGALDTVQAGVCGELFSEQTVESLLAVLGNFNPASYNPSACRTQAERFSQTNFRRKFEGYIEQVLAVNNY